MTRTRFGFLVALLLAAPTVACGGGDEVVSTATTATTAAAAATAAPALERPVVGKKAGDPPAALQINDLVVGTGAEAKSGSAVQVHYVGVLFKDGSEFDASWNRGEPFGFTIDAGQVIAGWDQGVTGMKVGGRRELVIPPDLAYGASGVGPIGPNETLVFVVDLIAVSG